jgi:hypothetical protein
MTVEVSPLSPLKTWSAQMSRWLSAQAAQIPDTGDAAEAQEADNRAHLAAQPPRPIWPRVFPGL